MSGDELRKMGVPPLVYSCSGCSNVAQAANAIAVRLDREGLAEMSCIAGVAAGVPSLVRTATSGRPMLAIDGCPLACCKTGLALQGVTPDHYVELGSHGFKKRQHEDLSKEEVAELIDRVISPVLESFRHDPRAKIHPAKEES